MSGSDNPYGGGYGQMRAQVNLGPSAQSAPTSAGSGAAAGGDLIKDTTTSRFAKDVLEASRQQPVLVDFWAPWCGPCRQLTPIIEKVVREAAGKVRLVKMNIDDHPEVAGQLGIQSIPAVVAFVNGRPADGFMGALPESQVRDFIARLPGGGAKADDGLGEQIEQALKDAASQLEAKNYQEAGGLYSAVLQADPENVAALSGLGSVLIGLGELAEARDLVEQLSDELKAKPELQALAKRLDQFEEARKLGDPAALEHQLALAPDDHAARLKLAKIRNAEGARDEAVDHLILIMKKDRTFEDDGARRQLLEFFEAWGPKDPATAAGRRKLSSVLFS